MFFTRYACDFAWKLLLTALVLVLLASLCGAREGEEVRRNAPREFPKLEVQAIYLLNTSFLDQGPFSSSARGLFSLWFLVCDNYSPFPKYVRPEDQSPLTHPTLSALAATWCVEKKGTVLQNPIFWSTSTPVGVYNFTQWERYRSYYELMLHCSAVQNCPGDSLEKLSPALEQAVENDKDVSIGQAPGAWLITRNRLWLYNETAESENEFLRKYGIFATIVNMLGIPYRFFMSGLLGGLAAASPCVGARFSTFVMSIAAPVPYILQMRRLPMDIIGPQAVTHAHTNNCGTDVWCATRVSQCVFRILPSSYTRLFIYAGDYSYINEGGLYVDLKVSMCDVSLSGTVDTETVVLVRDGFQAFFASAPSLYDQLSLPRSLIYAIVNRISSERGRPESPSILDSELCTEVFRIFLSFYHEGYLMQCKLPPELIGILPSLHFELGSTGLLESRIITVENDGSGSSGSRTTSTEEAWNCRFTIDLNRLVVNGTLELHSTGTMFLKFGATVDPPIIIGLGLLKGATVAVTRDFMPAADSPLYAANPSFDSSLLSGVPHMMLTVEYPEKKLSEVPSSTTYICADSVVCTLEQTYFEPLNRCGTTWCVGSLTVQYDASSLSCRRNTKRILLLCTPLLLFVVAEALRVDAERRARQVIQGDVQAVQAEHRQQRNARLAAQLRAKTKRR